jgi:rubredoxin
MIIEMMALFCISSVETEVFFMEMECYVCGICGHKYNPAKGEPLQNLAPGIPFGSLPEDWSCPVCFAARNDFVKE